MRRKELGELLWEKKSGIMVKVINGVHKGKVGEIDGVDDWNIEYDENGSDFLVPIDIWLVVKEKDEYHIYKVAFNDVCDSL